MYFGAYLEEGDYEDRNIVSLRREAARKVPHDPEIENEYRDGGHPNRNISTQKLKNHPDRGQLHPRDLTRSHNHDNHQFLDKEKKLVPFPNPFTKIDFLHATPSQIEFLYTVVVDNEVFKHPLSSNSQIAFKPKFP